MIIVMKHIACRKLYQYWMELREDGVDLPHRASFDPSAVKNLLPSVFIVNNSGKSMTGVIRLFGTGLTEVFDRELTGSNFFDLWERGDQHVIDQVFADLRVKSDPISCYANMTGPEGEIPSEFLFLPFRSNGGRIIVGVQVLTDTKNRRPGFAAPGLMTVVDWKAVKPHMDIRVADVFKKTPDSNVIDLSRRGRVPDHGRRVGHLVVFEGDAR